MNTLWTLILHDSLSATVLRTWPILTPSLSTITHTTRFIITPLTHHPLLEHNRTPNRTHFDSISVSGHKYFGFDELMGIFLTDKTILQQINAFHVPYLNDAVPTISCSRSALSPLKFWWKVKYTKKNGFQRQTSQILTNARYLKVSHPDPPSL